MPKRLRAMSPVTAPPTSTPKRLATMRPTAHGVESDLDPLTATTLGEISVINVGEADSCAEPRGVASGTPPSDGGSIRYKAIPGCGSAPTTNHPEERHCRTRGREEVSTNPMRPGLEGSKRPIRLALASPTATNPSHAVIGPIVKSSGNGSRVVPVRRSITSSCLPSSPATNSEPSRSHPHPSSSTTVDRRELSRRFRGWQWQRAPPPRR
jgi:hypothetical protein